MAETPIPDSLMALMRRVDTPTVCNAIEVAQGKRGFDNYTKHTLHASDPGAPSLVGFARTATLAAKSPPSEDPAVIRARRLDYFRHMASGPAPSIAVTGDLDVPDAVGAWWGEVHTTVHKGLGMIGAISAGPMRDLGDMAPDFPVLAGGLSPSHAFVHVRAIGEPVDIHGMLVCDGDLLHADRHGALVVPAEVVPALEAAINKLLDTEHLIIGPAREADFDIEKLEVAWRAFEQART